MLTLPAKKKKKKKKKMMKQKKKADFEWELDVIKWRKMSVMVCELAQSCII